MRHGLLAMMLSASAGMVCAGPARSQHLPPVEEQYRDLWAEPVPSMDQRPKQGRWHRPVFSELHRAVATTPIVPSDRRKERSVTDVFRRLGVFRPKVVHFRVTCRQDLCEYVIAYSRHLDAKQLSQASQSLNRATPILCPPQSCQSGAIIGGNRGGFAMLGYLIPTNGKFM